MCQIWWWTWWKSNKKQQQYQREYIEKYLAPCASRRALFYGRFMFQLREKISTKMKSIANKFSRLETGVDWASDVEPWLVRSFASPRVAKSEKRRENSTMINKHLALQKGPLWLGRNLRYFLYDIQFCRVLLEFRGCRMRMT